MWVEAAKTNQRMLLPRRVAVLGLVDTDDRDVCMEVDEYFQAWSEKGYPPFQQAMLLLIDGNVQAFLYAWTSGETKMLKTPTGAVLFAS